MRKTLKDLLLAVLNATLILVALCLFLMVLVLSKANALSKSFDDKLAQVAPIQNNIKSTLSETKALRKDIAALRSQPSDDDSAAIARIETGIDALDTRLSSMKDSVETLSQAPTKLVDHAIETAAQQAVLSITRIKGCTAPDA